MALDIKAKLEKQGHEMTFDWTNGTDIKPYNQNVAETQKLSDLALNGAIDADVFILIPEPGGTGMYVEYGAALAQFKMTQKPKIFLLGPHKEEVIFNFHPYAVWKETLEEILNEI